MPNRKPLFAPPFVKADDLNVLADQAFGTVSIEGADTEHYGGHTRINLPEQPAKIEARVYSDGASGGLSGSGPCSGANLYWWEEVQPGQCGIWSTTGLVGHSSTSPAYERNDLIVEDGTIVTLRPGAVWIDNNHSPPRLITEWWFDAGGEGFRLSGSGNNSVEIVSQLCKEGKLTDTTTTLTFRSDVTVTVSGG